MTTRYKADFIRLFNSFSGKHSRHELFSDFVSMATAAIHNPIRPDQSLEDNYMRIVKRYNQAELQLHTQMIAATVMGLDYAPCDFLGDVFMSLELGNAKAGQFFTPYCVSQMMAKLTFSPEEMLGSKPFIRLHDPACGAGSLPIAYFELMREEGFNPQQQLWMQCWDIDARVAEMCFIQLALLHVPAEIVIGNSLSLDVTRILRTPAHYLSNWDHRLKDQEESSAVVQPPKN